MHCRKEKLTLASVIAVLTAILCLTLVFCAPAYSTDDVACRSNNKGVDALKKNDFETAIRLFEKALSESHGYALAKENLAIAYNNYGISEQKTPKKCLRLFHMAMWLKPGDRTAETNLNVCVGNLGKKVSSFDDRVQLARNCEQENDFAGAIVEYRAALKIRDDAAVKKELAEVKIPENWKQWLRLDENENTTTNAAVNDVDISPNNKVDPNVDFGPYMADLQRRIRKAWYPPRGHETTWIVVLFKVHSDGTVSDIKLDKPSGMVAVDKAAISAVRACSPVHTLPKGSPAVIDIAFTFSYNVFSEGSEKKETESQLKKKIAKYLKEKNFKRVAETEVSLAEKYSEQDKDEEAIRQYKTALKLLKSDVDDSELEAKAASGLAGVYYAKDDYSSAQALFRHSLELQLRIGKDKKAIATTLRDLGYVTLFSEKGQADEAQSLLQQALKNAEELQDKEDNTEIRELVTSIRYRIAHCFWERQEYEQALDRYLQVLNETKKLDGDSPTSRVSMRQKDVADCYYELGKLPQALAAYKEAVATASKVDDEDQDQVDEAKTRILEIGKKIAAAGTSEGNASHSETNKVAEADASRSKTNTEADGNVLRSETKKDADKASSWWPYAVWGLLLAVLVLHIFNREKDE